LGTIIKNLVVFQFWSCIPFFNIFNQYISHAKSEAIAQIQGSFFCIIISAAHAVSQKEIGLILFFFK
jgi:hypothetical protein